MSQPKKWRWLFRAFVAFVFLLTAIAIRPVWHVAKFICNDPDTQSSWGAGVVNDASQLNARTDVEIINIPSDSSAAIEQLKEILIQAKAEGRKVSIAGRRHSMGGHTLYPGGVSINMLPFHAMHLIKDSSYLWVQAGATWSEVLHYLDSFRLSVSVMQAYSSFSVGGSLSVNCHGWQHNHEPIASTVVSLHLMMADGEIKNCSRTENAELFSLALGGYGLFGIILDATIRVVPNEAYTTTLHVFRADEYVHAYDSLINDASNIGLVFGRLNVTKEGFLTEALITAFHKDSTASPESLREPGWLTLRRAVFRSSVGSEYGKKLRWTLETFAGKYGSLGDQSRNQALYEDVSVYENRDSLTTDILHEYFIPNDSVTQFIRKIRPIVPSYKADLLNITIRNIRTDQTTFLKYANTDVFAFVMLFVQDKTSEGEKDMQELTTKLIDAAISVGGTYYLPYRLHASNEQFLKAYPQASEFFRLKRQYDPDELFNSEFYLRYAKVGQ